MPAQISIPVSNVSELLSLGYTKIEVHWSPDDGRHYVEVTSSVAQPAALTSRPATNTFAMDGKTLLLIINNGAQVNILFPAIGNKWLPSQVAAQINATVPGLATVSGNSVVLTSPTTGRISSILVGGSAGVIFPSDFSSGTDARPLLTDVITIYQFVDLAGRPHDRYLWRFSADGASPVSEYSKEVLGERPIVGPVSICTATFIGLDGRPQKRSVIFVSDTLLHKCGFVVGSPNRLTVESDEQGFLQAPLVIGTTVRVAVEGTAFVREFRVPNVESFDLLEAMATAPDPFTIQVPLPFLNRRHI